MKKILVVLLLFIAFNEYAQFAPSPSFFRTPRELPLTDFATTNTISVANYGAIANDGLDDKVAIQNAINAAVSASSAQNPVRLVFESGTYDLMPDESNTHAIQMTDANWVLWDGQNAAFLVHNPSIGFLSLLRCKNTIIKDITIDYAQLPFTQGVVTKVDIANGFFEFKVDANFPLPTETYFAESNQRWGLFKNANGSLVKGSNNYIPHNRFFELVGDRTYKYGGQTNGTLQSIKVGNYFVHMARNNGKTLISNTSGKNLTYLNVTGHASPAGGFNARESEEWNVINCQIKLKEGRVHTLNADAMHVNGGKFGPWVENSLFEGFADDCMNLKYTKREITTINSPNQITVKNSVFVGEIMEFYNPREGVSLGTASVTGVQALGGNLFRLTLSNNINITNITDPDHQLADKAYIENRSNESFIFRNNIVRNSRRYGILIQSKYALIENNLFQNLSQSGIRIENGVDWGEGFRADEIEIKNNTFENCGFDSDFIKDESASTITIDFMKLKNNCNTSTTWCGVQTTDWQGHSNIRILNNKILYNKRGVYLKNIDGLTFSNNFICHNGQDITLGANGIPVAQTILNSSNVIEENYNYDVPDSNLQFKLNERVANTTLVSSGTNTDIALKIISRGGEITQGFTDSEISHAVKINTEGNGELRLVDKNTEVVFPGPTAGAARTFSFWIKPEEAIFQTLLYSGGPTDGQVFSIQMQANRVLRVTDNNQNFISMADMPLDIGKWNHVAISVPENGTMSNISLYKNGVSSTEIFSGTDAFINTESNRIDFFPRFKGLASDIRYFDYNLCDGEIESIFNDRQATLSIDNELFDNSKIIVFPTVVSNTINFSKPIKAIKIVNTLGQVVISKENTDFSEINVSFLPSGLYIIKMNNAQTTKIYKN